MTFGFGVGADLGGAITGLLRLAAAVGLVEVESAPLFFAASPGTPGCGSDLGACGPVFADGVIVVSVDAISGGGTSAAGLVFRLPEREGAAAGAAPEATVGDSLSPTAVG